MHKLDIKQEHVYVGAKFLCAAKKSYTALSKHINVGMILTLTAINYEGEKYAEYIFDANYTLYRDAWKENCSLSADKRIAFVPLVLISDEALLLFKLSHDVEDLLIL